MSNNTLNTVVAERFVELPHVGIAHVRLVKLPAAQRGWFESLVSVEGNIGTAGPVIYCRNHVLDYAVDMYEHIADNPNALRQFVLDELY